MSIRRGPFLAAYSRDIFHCTVLIFTVVVGAITPLLFNSNFYFYADTAEGAYGQWFELGKQLRSGAWPLMNPNAWMAGNYAAEGQWGLWNPIVLLIGVAVSFSTNAVIICTIIKIFFLLIGATGVYALSRELGAHAPWAFLAGLACSFAGFTLFMDATSWVTNEMVWAFSAWTIWGIHRYVTQHCSILVPAITGYLLITVGYVEGTLVLVLFYLSLIGTVVIKRNWHQLRSALLISIIHGLFAVTVYLPGVLTSPVTQRANTTTNSGFMVLNLTGLATSTVGFTTGPLNGWWGAFEKLPLLYIAWFLPLIALVSAKRARFHLPRLAPLLVFGILVLMLAMGPSDMGPLRFPSRALPWITMVSIITVVVLFDRARCSNPSAMRLAFMTAWAIFGAWLVYSATPEDTSAHWHYVAVHLAVYFVGFACAWWWCRHSRSPRYTLRFISLSQHALPIVMVLICGVVLLLQARFFAPLVQSRSEYPAEKQPYEQVLATGHGDGIVVGDPLSLHDAVARQTDFGNFWYLNHVKVQNLYTPVGFQTYSENLCLLYDGRSCSDLLTTLFSEDPTTHRQLVDLLSLDTVQILPSKDLPMDEVLQRVPPAGWQVTAKDSQSVTWARQDQSTDAGEVAWSTPGLKVTQGENSNLSSKVHIDHVPVGGGDIVFSRLNWPGYRVTNGTLADPLRGYLLTIHVPGDFAGKDVTVTFRPPGWSAGVSAFGVAWFLAISTTVISAVRRRKQKVTDSPIRYPSIRQGAEN